MRKAQKKQVEELLKMISETHKEIKKGFEHNTQQSVVDALMQCQQNAIELGNMIEASEGEGFITVLCLEEYCEAAFQAYEEVSKNIGVNPNKIYKLLNKSIIKVENSAKNDIRYRSEAVFLPYKAAMWDSLESVWKAADADPDCDAYVIPIPYYDRNSDGSFKEMHYEGASYPEYVPIIKYDEFDFEAHRPDMIFIHNPYDNWNYVTSVHPYFYSENLKKYTDCLVYIPYYSTAGGMSEGQALCPAYMHADYIVIQSEKYRKFFNPEIPDEKFLPLGSPKFDNVIHQCQNPPKPPEEWREKMAGKKVYFYNTSINGMLRNTEAFLKKMEYVFDIFCGREDVCLLWRPHPLLESTFESMRREYKLVYEDLKKRFIKENIGILDLTSDIESTIAFCDAYIGDSGTSVTSLFGVAGKPLFALDNNIHTLPGEDDWRGNIIKGVYMDGQNQWYVTQGNKLYYSPRNDFYYEYFCDLSEYVSDTYYQRAIEFEDRVYVCPRNAQEILVISKNKHVKKVILERCVEQPGAFSTMLQIREYLFIFPGKYSSVVRFNMRTLEVHYITGIKDFYINEVNGERRLGGIGVWDDTLIIGSPDGSKIFRVEADSLETEVFDVNIEGGILCIIPDEKELWLLPYEGTTVACWAPDTGEITKYNVGVEGYQCYQRPLGYECDVKPFSGLAICGDQIIFSPLWGNKFVSLNKETGNVEEWLSPIRMQMKSKNGYYPLGAVGYFVYCVENSVFRYYDAINRKIYDIDVRTKEYKEIEIVFNREELKKHEAGFAEISQWMQYCCCENAFNSLEDFIDGNIIGNQFDKKRQLIAFSKINASVNGDCGEKVYRYIMERVQ